MLRHAVIALAVLCAAGTAHADGIWGGAYANPWSSWDAYSYKRVEGQVRAKTKSALGKAAASDAKPAKPRPLKATDFKRRKGGGRPVLDEYLAQTKLPADQASQLKQTIEGILKEIESQVRKNNVATSMAVLIAAANYVVNGVEIDDATEEKLIASLNEVLAADASFRKLKSIDKERMNDTLLIQASLILALAAWGQQDPSAKQSADQASRAALLFLTGSETGPAQ